MKLLWVHQLKFVERHEKISAEVPGTKLLTLRFKQKFNKISAKFYVFSFNWPFLV